MLFFVKVRIDMNKLVELGQKLESGELNTSHIVSTHCIQDDLTVGLNIWQAESREEFDKAFEPHKQFYAEVMEITPVVTPEESKQMLMEQFSGG